MIFLKKLLIIDGNSLLNRAYYGIRPLTTKDGIPTNAVYGFINILNKHTEAIKPDFMACAFDVKAPTFRHKQYEGYKANRKGMPDDLAAQLPYAKEAAKLLGFTVIECPGYEADDVLGTVCAEADKTGDIMSYIVTGDRDSLQLITKTTSVILAKTKEDITYDPDRFMADFGVTPDRYVDVKALMGDSSDNIPGVAGIGEKTAFKLIAENGSLDELYAKLDEIKLTPSVRKNLTEGKDSAYMSFALAKISREAPCIGCIYELLRNEIDYPNLKDLLVKLEFGGLLKKLIPEKNGTDAAPSIVFPEIKKASLASLASLGCLPAVAYSDGKLYFSDGESTFEAEAGEDEIADTLTKKHFICHDYKKLCTAFPGKIKADACEFDTMLASYLIAPGQSSYPIGKAALKYLGVQQNEYSPAEEAYLAAKLHEPLSAELEADGMTKLLRSIEIPLAEVLSDMEKAGFKVDSDKLKGYAEQLRDTETILANQIYMQAGSDFNLNSPKQLSDVLFTRLGLPAGKKTKSGFSTDAETLSKLRAYHPIVADILDYRQISKLRGTYADTLPAMTDENGRIHTTFNQTGTATGRLSSSDPNLQNIPARAELGKELRKFFIAKDEDHVLIDADYSQIELRLMAELSGDETMREAFRSGSDIHSTTASQVFRVPLADVTKELRLRAKAVNFGIIYGIGAYSLSQDLGITMKRASEYIAGYLETYPKVDEYLKKTVAEAKENGYTTTMFGRRRPIPELSSPNKNTKAFGERVAMNSPIQGTAADVIKLAMINVSRALKEANLDAKLILQVHDELIIESSRKDASKAAEILVHEMENAIKSSVKLTAEVGIGDNWLDAK